MITIYHNPRCSKSRQGVTLLEEHEQNFQVVKYLDTVPTTDELQKIITLLNIKPIELVRTKEPVWKENFKDKNLSDTAIIEAMVAYPRLIERPIVINGDKAVIGRPTEKILDIL